jgi:O-antigen/teichoic acid export membrane protein
MACTAVYYYADSVMLGMFRSQREVGLYAAAYVPILGLSLLVTAIRNAYLPSQSEAAARNPRDHARVLRQYGRITMMAALPAAIVGPVLAAPVLGVLYGSEFLDAAIALRLLFVTAGVMFLSSYFGSELLVRGRQRTYLVGVGAGAGTNLVLNLLLIPSFGPVGAASATLASEGLVCAFVWWQTRSGSVQVIDLALRAAGAAAVAAAAVLLAAQLTPFIVAAAVAVPAYAAALAVFDGAALRRQFPLATSAGLRAD